MIRLYPPSNDYCLSLGDDKYVDIIFAGRNNRWRLLVRNRHAGFFKTKRLAKKRMKELL